MVESQESTARLEEQAAALEYKLADAATFTNRSENQCPQQQRLDEIAFHKEERTVFKRWLEREHVGAAEASEAASKADARHKRQAAQAELQAKQLDAELKKARAALHTLSTTTPAAVASRISGLKREWEALGSALRRCRARHADVCTRQGVAEKQLQEEERMSQQLSDSINNLKRTNAAARATAAAATTFTEDTTDKTSTASCRGRGRGRGNGTTTNFQRPNPGRAASRCRLIGPLFGVEDRRAGGGLQASKLGRGNAGCCSLAVLRLATASMQPHGKSQLWV
eukprot:TRINITY_DN4338_c0_g1_i2.p1 TRINITY_DN4338_c0_g1~~TRINITY_DN4338_c0_g1_i2.p1  ORF type:complete len:283 (+),score=70.99 TRINITY_DN4338_c0_g1_i2:211-1059(+)